jgi:hypothetical protein
MQHLLQANIALETKTYTKTVLENKENKKECYHEKEKTLKIYDLTCQEKNFDMRTFVSIRVSQTRAVL